MSDPNQPYHNQGFGSAFLWIIIVMFIIPVMAMMTLDDTWDDFQFPFGGTDTVITLKQIIAYATDFRVKSPADVLPQR